MIDVVVAGAAGKMGREVVKAVTAAEGMQVVAAVDTGYAGPVEDGAGGQIECMAELPLAIARHKPRVLVDFTHPDTVVGNVRLAVANGIDTVVGTTGIPLETLKTLEREMPHGVCLFHAPNFAIGAVLMMRFAAQAARYMPHVEVIELHHDRKADAPSGTALRTASMIAEARATVPDSPGTETETIPGARGALAEEVRVHSVRLPGLVAHQEVLFGGQGQTLSIRHDSIDRTSFMPGVVYAISKVGELSGLVMGLETILDL